MKYLRLAIPTSVFFMCILNLALALFEQNSMAAWANVTAMFGWFIVSADEWLNFKTSALFKE